MNLNEMFPSRFLKAADLQGRRMRLRVSHVACELLEGSSGKEQKAVLHFAGKDKALVLNKTNALEIGGAYGQETDDWRGREVVLFPTRTQFGAKMVDCIRVEIPDRVVPETPNAVANNDDDGAGDVPF
jgi:hypothetical protein